MYIKYSAHFLSLNLTYESSKKAHCGHEMKWVVAVVVTVDLQGGEGAQQEGDLYVVVPGGEGFESGKDLNSKNKVINLKNLVKSWIKTLLTRSQSSM